MMRKARSEQQVTPDPPTITDHGIRSDSTAEERRRSPVWTRTRDMLRALDRKRSR